MIKASRFSVPTMAWLFCVILLVAKVALVVWAGPVSIEMDAAGYWDLSTRILEGDLLFAKASIAYRTPAYPWFLSVARWLCGQHALLAATIMQASLYVLTIVMAADLSVRVSKREMARWLTIALMVPAISAVCYIPYLLTETAFVFLMTLNLWVTLCYVQSPNFLKASLLGATFGLTLLTRPIVMLLWIAHVAIVIGTRWTRIAPTRDAVGMKSLSTGRLLTHAALIAGLVALLLTPWLARNQQIFGRAFLTEFTGRNIWIVTFQDGSGAGLELPSTQESNELQSRLEQVDSTKQWHAEQWRHTWSVSNALVESGLDDAAADRLMKRVSIQASKDSPRSVIYKMVRRCVNFWRCTCTDLPIANANKGKYQGQAVWGSQAPIVRWLRDHRLSQSLNANTCLMLGMLASLVYLIACRSTRLYGIWLAMILGYFGMITGILEIPDYRYRLIVEPLVATTYASAIALRWGTCQTSYSSESHLAEPMESIG